MKVDYQKEITPSPYKFLPIHLQWSGVHVALSAMLFYVVANRLPDGKTQTNGFVCSIIGLVVFSVIQVLQFLNSGKAGQLSQPKHNFLKKYRTIFTKAVASCLLLSAILSCFVPYEFWKFGAAICLLTVVCLWGGSKIPPQSPNRVFIEIFMAVLYATGIWGCNLMSQGFKNVDSNVLGLVFFLLTFQILLLLSHFEALDRSTTLGLARLLGKPRTRHAIYAIAIVTSMICVTLCFNTEFRYIQRISVIFTAITLFQLFIYIQSSQVENRRYLWMAAEFSTLFPLLLL